MPANLTPQYHKAEQAFRQATSPDEELRCLELMLREIPKHKGTDKLQAELKHKISRAKEQVEQAKKAGGKKSAGIRIPRQGAGRVVILGGPNAGKSQLLRSLTRATPEVAAHPFTTRECSPGMMPWEDVFVQLIDTPPITADVLDPDLLGLIRGSDLALLLVDVGTDEGLEALQECHDHLQSTKTRLGKESYLDEEDIGVAYTQTILVETKTDLPESADRLALMKELYPLEYAEMAISAENCAGLDALKEAIYRSLDVVRVYTKLPHKKEPDMDKPFTVKRGGTILDVAELVHRDLAAGFKHARIWGTGVIGGSTAKGDYVLSDKDIIEIHAE